MKYVLSGLIAVFIFLAGGVLVLAQSGDALIVTIRLEADGRVWVSSVTQGPAPKLLQAPFPQGEYKLVLYQKGKKLAEHGFNLVLSEMEVLPADSKSAPSYVKAKTALQHRVLPLGSSSGGTTADYKLEVLKGEQVVFASSLDKIEGFTREAGVKNPIRTVGEIELLKKASPPARGTQPPGEKPLDQVRGDFSPWGFLFGAIAIVVLILAGLWYYRRKQEERL